MFDRLVMVGIDEEIEKRYLFNGENLKFFFGFVEFEVRVEYLCKDKL